MFSTTHEIQLNKNSSKFTFVSKVLRKGLPTNKLPNIVGWAEKPARIERRAFRPTPQEVVEYFFIWKCLKA